MNLYISKRTALCAVPLCCAGFENMFLCITVAKRGPTLDAKSMNARAPIPILRSFDEDATRDFYLGFLSFRLEFEHRFGPDAPLYMGVRLDNCVIHLSEHHGDATPGSSIRIEVEDVNAFATRLNTQAYKFARPGVIRQDWGFDEMPIADPSGNRLVFCTPVPAV